MIHHDTDCNDSHDELGQSPWLDNLKRSYLTSGELADIRDRGIRGLTSNPTIFQKAIQGSADYDEQFATLAGDQHPILARLLGDGVRRHPRSMRRARLRLRLFRRRRRLRIGRGRAGSRPRRARHGRRRTRSSPAPEPPQSDGEDPRHCRRCSGDPADDLRGPQHQRHADLLARPLRGRDGGVHQRSRSRSPPTPTPTCRRSPASAASSSHESTPRSTVGSRRSAPSRRWRCAARLQ